MGESSMSETGRPQLAVISSMDPEEPMALSLASRLIESGIFFAGIAEGEFSGELPENPGLYRALLIQRDVFDEIIGEGGGRLDRLSSYAAEGGHVYLFDDPGKNAEKLVCDMDASLLIESMIPHTYLTRRHPSAAKIQAERKDAELLDGFKSRLMNYLSGGKAIWGEFSLHYWKAAIMLIGTGGHEDVRGALIKEILRLSHAMPAGYNHNETAGLFAPAWLYGETGDRGPFEKALGLMDKILEKRPRVEGLLASDGFADDPLCLKPENHAPIKATSRRNVVWTENLHMLCPGLAAMTRVSGDGKYLDEAMKIASYVKERHQDSDGLIIHCTRGGEPVSSKWSRGMAHALYGIIYMADELEPGNSGRKLLLECLVEAARGLKESQDPETGLWRNVVDNRQARIESSGSICFVYVCARGINEGWLEGGEYRSMVEKGYEGLKGLYWRGGLAANCRGTGLGMDEVYYLSRPQGWAVVPWFTMAHLEVLKMRGEPGRGEKG